MGNAKDNNTVEHPLIDALRAQAVTDAICLDVRGVAALLSVSPRTVRHWAADPVDPLRAITKKGKLLFRLRDVTAWLDTPRGGAQATGASEDMDGILERHRRKMT